METTTKQTHTPGPWEWAVDSYGKVQHSRKYDCVYTTIKGNGGDRLQTIAARIEHTPDARLIAAAPELAAELRDNILRWSSSGVTLKDLERVGWLLEKAGLRLEGCEL